MFIDYYRNFMNARKRNYSNGLSLNFSRDVISSKYLPKAFQSVKDFKAIL